MAARPPSLPMRALLALFILLPLSMGAGAQEPAKEPEALPAPLDVVAGPTVSWFAQHEETHGYWMSPLQDDPNATDDAAGYDTMDVLGTVIEDDEPSNFEWDIPLFPRLHEPLTLDASRSVDFTLYMSLHPGITGGLVANGTLPGWTFDLAVALRQGNLTIANGTLEGVRGNATFQMYNLSVPLNASLNASAIDPEGGSVNWTIRAAGMSTGYLLGLANSTGHSNVRLPIVLPPAPPPAVVPAQPAPPPIPTVTVTVTKTVTWTRTMTVGYTFVMDQVDPHEESLPGPGIAAAVAAVVVAAFAVRRRL